MPRKPKITLIGANSYDDFCHDGLLTILNRIEPDIVLVEDSKSDIHPCYFNQDYINFMRERGVDLAPFKLESPCRMYCYSASGRMLVPFPSLESNQSAALPNSIDVAYDMANYSIEGKLPEQITQNYLSAKRENATIDDVVKILENAGEPGHMAVVVPVRHVIDDLAQRTLYSKIKHLSPQRLVLKPAFAPRMALRTWGIQDIVEEPKKISLYERFLSVVDDVVERAFCRERNDKLQIANDLTALFGAVTLYASVSESYYNNRSLSAFEIILSLACISTTFLYAYVTSFDRESA